MRQPSLRRRGGGQPRVNYGKTRFCLREGASRPSLKCSEVFDESWRARARAASMAQAENLKAHGNECFAKGKLDAAIEAYSECICLSPGVAVYHTNRALCYHRKEMWDAVVRDCGVVLTIDSRSVKAHYLMGTALVEQQKLHEGTEALHRSLQLCRDLTVSYKDDILRALLSARKRIWEVSCAEADAALDGSEALVGQVSSERAVAGVSFTLVSNPSPPRACSLTYCVLTRGAAARRALRHRRRWRWGRAGARRGGSDATGGDDDAALPPHAAASARPLLL